MRNHKDSHDELNHVLNMLCDESTTEDESEGENGVDIFSIEDLKRINQLEYANCLVTQFCHDYKKFLN